MQTKTVIALILVLFVLGTVGISSALPMIEGASASRTLTEMSDVGTYLDSDITKANVTLKVVHPQYGMNLQMPFLRPFTTVTSFAVKDPYDSSVSLYNVTFAAKNSATIAKTATVTGTFSVTDLESKLKADTAGSVTLTLPDLSNTVGLESMFPTASEAYLESFFKGFIPFKDSLFYSTYSTTPTTISANPKTIFKNLASALFETYEFQTNGTLVATPLSNSFNVTATNIPVTIMGVSAPDKYAIKNIGKISNGLSRSEGASLRYLYHTERNRDYVTSIIVNKVFDGVSVGKEDVITSLVDSVMQVPLGCFIVPEKKFKTNPENKLPMVRPVN